MAAPEWTLEDLREHLQAALEIELLVIPPYLCALYSLHPGSNLEAELIIRSVVVEEMLHMVLAANLLNAVGGDPAIGRGGYVPRYPARIPHHSGHLAVDVQPFGRAALQTFLAIEYPSYDVRERREPPPDAGVPRLLTLRGGDGYPTIGDFYAAVRAGLEALVAELGEAAVFTGDRERQIGPEQYYGSGGRARRIEGLEDARAAIEEIVEQGEGEVTFPPAGGKFDPDRDLAHFYRFNELFLGRRYRPDDLPSDPTGPPIELDLAAVYPMRANVKVADLPASVRPQAEACNAIWMRLLDQLEQAFGGRPELVRDAVATMFELKYAAQGLLHVPLGDGTNAGPTFETVSGSPPGAPAPAASASRA